MGYVKSIRPLSKRAAFTLVELLVVIAIIGVLIALLLPAVQQAREAARRSQCMNNMKQIGLALHLHHDSYKKLPTGHVPFTAVADGPMHEATWAYFILPYMEQSALYDLADLTRSFGYTGTHPNVVVNKQKLETMLCPSDTNDVPAWYDSFAHRSYVVNNGIGPMKEGSTGDEANRNREDKGVMYMASKTRFADVTDGTSNTVAIAEILNVHPSGGVSDQRGVNYPEGAFYHHNYTPNDKTPDQTRTGHCVSTLFAPCVGAFSGAGDRQLLTTPRSNHPGGVNVTMVDGSVHFVPETIALDIWRSAGTPATVAGEVIFSGF